MSLFSSELTFERLLFSDGSGRECPDPCRLKFWQISAMGISYSQMSSELSFENFTRIKKVYLKKGPGAQLRAARLHWVKNPQKSASWLLCMVNWVACGLLKISICRRKPSVVLCNKFFISQLYSHWIPTYIPPMYLCIYIYTTCTNNRCHNADYMYIRIYMCVYIYKYMYEYIYTIWNEGYHDSGGKHHRYHHVDKNIHMKYKYIICTYILFARRGTMTAAASIIDAERRQYI